MEEYQVWGVVGYPRAYPPDLTANKGKQCPNIRFDTISQGYYVKCSNSRNPSGTSGWLEYCPRWKWADNATASNLGIFGTGSSDCNAYMYQDLDAPEYGYSTTHRIVIYDKQSGLFSLGIGVPYAADNMNIRSTPAKHVYHHCARVLTRSAAMSSGQ